MRLPEPAGGIVALGAHADDIEIGAGGLLMTLMERYPSTRLSALVFTGDEVRRSEALRSVTVLSGGSGSLAWLGAADGFLPYEDPAEAKRFLVESTRALEPDLVVCPNLQDSHQDHRFVAELAWQRFRRSWILEYEIPKWESEAFDPTFFVPLENEIADRKLDHLDQHFESQHNKPWYDRALFEAQLRVRGLQCGSRLAEGFVSRKVVAT